MTKDEYAEYLQSAHWQNFRKEYLDEISTCDRCKMPRWLAEIAYNQDLHLHHKNYARLGKEEWEDIEILCRRCHELETFGRSELKAPKASTCGLCRDTHWDYRADFCKVCSSLILEPYLYFNHNRRLDDGETLAVHLLAEISRCLKGYGNED